jgi:hypothetical protein
VKHLGNVADAVAEEQCKWACFISHHQGAASHTVLLLAAWMEKKLKELGKRLTEVWVDKGKKATPEGMHEGVRLSRHFILFLTRDVLKRDWCLNEIRMALKYHKNIILVYQTDARFGGVPGPFAEFYGPELKKVFPNEDDYKWLTKTSYVEFHDRGQHADVMLCDSKCENGILDQMQLEDVALLTVCTPSLLPHFPSRTNLHGALQVHGHANGTDALGRAT